jgi:prevent-host-death family protein
MEKVVNVHTAKTTLSKLLAEVENGEEVVIARDGKPIAKLVKVKSRAATKQREDRKPGFLKGKIWIGPNFDEPLPEEILAPFRGEHE